ncbi:hypothetical protein N7522_009621 [Penicillium canescens]|nr:hypothetical protein N7522_009621 [Penicillium canescens]KAJ6177439.1 hypothetical protein N7485_004353 [Penicillium canescens]
MEQSTPKYVGSPSREIDEAWAHLLSDKSKQLLILMQGLNMDLEGHEADHLHWRTFQWPDSGHYFTGLEVFHSLHCLNRLRQALYPNYYNIFNDPNDPPRGHCINHLRQAIQCHADLTPMEWTLTGNKLILSTDTMHTCRNFEVIHDLAIKRRSDYNEKELIVNGSIFIVD